MKSILINQISAQAVFSNLFMVQSLYYNQIKMQSFFTSNSKIQSQQQKPTNQESKNQSPSIQSMNDQFILFFLQNNRRLDTFLHLIPSSKLRQAYKKKEKAQDQLFRQYNSNIRTAVINLTIEQLKKRCLAKNLIPYFDFMQHNYTIYDHALLGMKLVINFPFQYQVGQKAQQYQIGRSELLNKLYAPYLNFPINQRNLTIAQSDEQQNSSDQQFINDEYQQDGNISGQVEEQQNQNDQQDNQENQDSQSNKEQQKYQKQEEIKVDKKYLIDSDEEDNYQNNKQNLINKIMTRSMKKKGQSDNLKKESNNLRSTTKKDKKMDKLKSTIKKEKKSNYMDNQNSSKEMNWKINIKKRKMQLEDDG